MTSTEMCKLEKGEYTHLLNEDDVKVVVEGRHKPFSWIRCLVRIVLITLVVLVLVGVSCATGTYFWMRHQVRRFTVAGADENLPQPPLPVAPMPASQLEVVKDKAKLFWDELRAGEPPAEDFVITQDELNGLIASSDFLRGHAFVTLTENKWYTDLALPADKLPGGKGRFFLGHGVITTASDDESAEKTRIVSELTPKHHVAGLDFESILLGKYVAYRNTEDAPVIELDYGQFLNWVAPEEWLGRRENLLDCEIYDSSDSSDSSDDGDDDIDCQEFMTTVSLLESITLQENKIVFTPRRGDSMAEVTGSRRRRLTTGSMEGEVSSNKDAMSWRGTLFRRLLLEAF